MCIERGAPNAFDDSKYSDPDTSDMHENRYTGRPSCCSHGAILIESKNKIKRGILFLLSTDLFLFS